jgi:hypothetical protein
LNYHRSFKIVTDKLEYEKEVSNGLMRSFGSYLDMRIELKCEFIDDGIGTDRVCMDGIGIESRSHRKDSVMEKKVGFPTHSCDAK